MKRLHLLLAYPRPDAVPPGLATLLARGEDVVGPAADCPSLALARLFDVADGSLAPLALAPLALAAEGIEPGADTWFRADPVHLSPGLHHVVVMDSRAYALAAEEAEALVDGLNRHFAGELDFIAPHPLRWYARARPPLRVVGPPLDRVAGGILTPGMFTGPDAGILQRHATEIQMLLHAHPVNDAREVRGELPINGVWFWGGGEYRAPPSPFSQVLADDFDAMALARAAGIPHQPLPARFDPHRLPEGDTLAVLDLGPGTRFQWDGDWFDPLLTALQRGGLNELTIELVGPDGIARRLDRRAAWKLWRR